MARPRILLVEDNQVIGEAISARLSLIGTVAWLISEKQFLNTWQDVLKEPPDVAVVDVMLRWDYPRPDVEPKPLDRDLYTAGIRCATKLRSTPETEDVQVILYTVIERSELQKNLAALPEVVYLQKEPDLAPLAAKVEELTTGVQSLAR